MPRGYFKNQHQGIGRKKSRGGSSKKERPAPCCRCSFCCPSTMRFQESQVRFSQVIEMMEEEVADCTSYESKIQYSEPSLDLMTSDDESVGATPLKKPDSNFLSGFLDFNALFGASGNQTIQSFDESHSLYSLGYSLVEEGTATLSDSSSFDDVDIKQAGSICSISDSYVNLETIESDTYYLEGDQFVQVELETRVVETETRNGRKESSSWCAICEEEAADLVQLMKKCCHPTACRSCLREKYIAEASENYANYPLKCFWPGCERVLCDVQVERIACTTEEMERHYANKSKAKRLRRRLAAFKNLHKCPGCCCANLARPYILNKLNPSLDGTSFSIKCYKCTTVFPAERLPATEILSVMAALEDDFANCPSCGTFIERDGGCDHMTCICGQHFNLSKEQV